MSTITDYAYARYNMGQGSKNTDKELKPIERVPKDEGKISEDENKTSKELEIFINRTFRVHKRE